MPDWRLGPDRAAFGFAAVAGGGGLDRVGSVGCRREDGLCQWESPHSLFKYALTYQVKIKFLF